MGDGQPRLAVALRDPLPWADLLELARSAEDAGYEAVCTPEVGARDPYPMLAGIAAATTSIRLVTGVLSIEHRAPVAAATGAATLHELSGGRHVLGLGAGHRSLDDLLAYVDEVRTVLKEHPLADPPPPVWFAALGDRAVEASARHADGVILNWCTPERVARAAGSIRRVRPAGDGLTIAVYVRCCLTGVNDRGPLEALRAQTAAYASMPHYRRQLEAMGLGDEAAAAVKALAEDHLELVPEGLVDALCVRGGREAFRERASAYAEAGADLVVVYPVPARDPASSMLGTILAAAPDPAGP